MEGNEVKYLLDTACWINGVTMPEVLPERIRRMMESVEPKGLCSISLLETAMLHRLGRLEFQGGLARLFAAGLASDLRLLELTPAIAAKSGEFSSGFHGDPFDRTIVATAAVMKLTLITADPAIRKANLCALEYYPFKPSRTERRRQSGLGEP